MGKKKRTQQFVLKPWCWYCEREFEDEKVLLQHQKSKHFKCQLCPRKLNTAGGLMVHSQQVHKCEPEPLTNTLPGRDGYDIEIFGMEGVPTNALAEWKANKEEEAGSAAMGSGLGAARPRHIYGVIPEADLQAALIQHKALMARRDVQPMSYPSFPPPMPPNFPIGSLPPGFPPGFPPPPGYAPSFAPPFPPPNTTPQAMPSPSVRPPPTFLPQAAAAPEPAQAPSIQPPKDGVMWPDASAAPAEKRAQQPRYRYTSPSIEAATGTKRKAAADFL